jgi:hypothetical protein
MLFYICSLFHLTYLKNNSFFEGSHRNLLKDALPVQLQRQLSRDFKMNPFNREDETDILNLLNTNNPLPYLFKTALLR